jgi:hypothetical protein
MLYRVCVSETNSLQPNGFTHWKPEVLYSGYDRDEARRIYHENKVQDYFQGHGSPSRKTTCESIKDADTEDFSDDVAEVIEV